MNPKHIPLLAPKPLTSFTASEFFAYVKALWIDPASTKKSRAKGPTKYLTHTVTKKGTLVVRCKRDPKQVTREEFEAFKESAGLSYQEAWLQLQKRSIEVVEKIQKITIKP